MAAAVHGSAGFFSLDNSSGSVIDLTGFVRDVNFTLDTTMHDTTTFGQVAHTKTVGLKDGKFTVTFVSSATPLAQVVAMFAAQTPGTATTWSFVYGPRGSTSGFEKFPGECYISSLPIPAVVDNIEMLTVSFEVSGPVTPTTF